jgi:hypothetical protein
LLEFVPRQMLLMLNYFFEGLDFLIISIIYFTKEIENRKVFVLQDIIFWGKLKINNCLVFLHLPSMVFIYDIIFSDRKYFCPRLIRLISIFKNGNYWSPASFLEILLHMIKLFIRFRLLFSKKRQLIRTYINSEAHCYELFCCCLLFTTMSFMSFYMIQPAVAITPGCVLKLLYCNK